ncbi:Serine/threonine protein kinase [Minicystis rosea]|nr:Serine/threonine protein kinase [Minicystis rosea]
MSAPAALKIGSVFLGRFEISGLLGQGGMGRVYKAHDMQLGRDVAIKVMLRKLARDPVYVERFKREARAVARFNHPNIATVYDVGETEQRELYMIQEFLDGISLRDMLDEDGRLPRFKALHYAFQAADALAAAHAKHVIHRDIKPENMIVGRGGRLTVVDFGLAAPRDITLDTRLQLA